MNAASESLTSPSVRTASVPTLRRLPLYLRVLREMQEDGQAYASGAVVAKALQLDPIVVRKDMAMTGVTGRPRLGFPVDELIKAIETFLGWTNMTDAVLCGVGSLGRALLGYDGFQQHGLRIVAAFDLDPAKVNTKDHGVRIYTIGKLPAIIKSMHVQLGILTVPAEAAQAVAEVMVNAGIRGIWNFTPVKLNLPDDVIIQRVDLASSLAVLSHRLYMQPPPSGGRRISDD
jgi:redox-sensing transcriptional repressor